jgi:hypothetical protein
MEKADREAVFRKAGTRQLPIVYIDDKYIGDHKTLFDLEESGELDKLLKLNAEKFKKLALTASSNFEKKVETVPTTQMSKVSISAPKATSTPAKTSTTAPGFE